MKVRGWVIYLPFRVMHFFKKQTPPPHSLRPTARHSISTQRMFDQGSGPNE